MWTARADMPSQPHLELSAPRSIGHLPAAQLYLVPDARVTDHVAAVGGVAAEALLAGGAELSQFVENSRKRQGRTRKALFEFLGLKGFSPDFSGKALAAKRGRCHLCDHSVAKRRRNGTNTINTLLLALLEIFPPLALISVSTALSLKPVSRIFLPNKEVKKLLFLKNVHKILSIEMGKLMVSFTWIVV